MDSPNQRSGSFPSKASQPPPSWETPALQSPALVQEAVLLSASLLRVAMQADPARYRLVRSVAQLVSCTVGRSLSPAAAWVQAVEESLEARLQLERDAGPDSQ